MGSLPLAQTLGECRLASLLLLGLGRVGVSPRMVAAGKFTPGGGGMRNGSQSSRLFWGKLKGFTFFFPLSSSGLSSRTPGDKPVAHVVGKSSEGGLRDAEAGGLGRARVWELSPG